MFGQQQYNPYFNQPQNQFNQEAQQKQIMAEYHKQGFITCLRGVEQLKAKQEFQNLLILLRCLQKQSLSCIEKACSPQLLQRERPSQNSALSEAVKKRFRVIKDRNNDLLIKILNLREKMVHQMYMHKVRSPKTEVQIDHLSQKIRSLKLSVNNKYTQLKFLKMTRPARKSTEKRSNFGYLNRSLDDLKRGAQVLEKDVLRVRQQLNLFVRHIHGQQI